MKKSIIGLIVLSLVPFLSGLSRLFDLSTGLIGLDGRERFAADPLPAVFHIVGATAFATVGALQFIPSLRRGAWHRRAGRVLGVLGIAAAIAGVVMALSWPHRPYEGPITDCVRITVAFAIIALIVNGVAAARRRDWYAHEVSMTRAYALWAGGGTQALTLSPFLIEGLAPLRGDVMYASLMLLAWLINLAVAEWAVRREAVLA